MFRGGGSKRGWHGGRSRGRGRGRGRGRPSGRGGARRGGQRGHGGRNPTSAHRPGDWTCAHCDAHNYASRTECFKCSSSCPHGSSSNDGSRSGRKASAPSPRHQGTPDEQRERKFFDALTKQRDSSIDDADTALRLLTTAASAFVQSDGQYSLPLGNAHRCDVCISLPLPRVQRTLRC